MVIECRDGNSDDDNNYDDDDFGFCTLVADVRFKTLVADFRFCIHKLFMEYGHKKQILYFGP